MVWMENRQCSAHVWLCLFMNFLLPDHWPTAFVPEIMDREKNRERKREREREINKSMTIWVVYFWLDSFIFGYWQKPSVKFVSKFANKILFPASIFYSLISRETIRSFVVLIFCFNYPVNMYSKIAEIFGYFSTTLWLILDFWANFPQWKLN